MHLLIALILCVRSWTHLRHMHIWTISCRWMNDWMVSLSHWCIEWVEVWIVWLLGWPLNFCRHLWLRHAYSCRLLLILLWLLSSIWTHRWLEWLILVLHFISIQEWTWNIVISLEIMLFILNVYFAFVLTSFSYLLCNIWWWSFFISRWLL